MTPVSEADFKRAGVLMAIYCGLCGAAFFMTVLLAFFGDELVTIF